jgi:hypothetical protein
MPRSRRRAEGKSVRMTPFADSGGLDAQVTQQPGQVGGTPSRTTCAGSTHDGCTPTRRRRQRTEQDDRCTESRLANRQNWWDGAKWMAVSCWPPVALGAISHLVDWLSPPRAQTIIVHFDQPLRAQRSMPDGGHHRL